MARREFSEKERQRLASQGKALEDGSYPQPDCDAVRRAIRAYGRAPASHRHKLAVLIRRRNDQLSCGHELEELEEA